MIYIGIDPGKSGAYAVLTKTWIKYGDFDKAEILSVLHDVAREPDKAICCLEKVHAMPKQGSVSMFTFGENYGWLKGVLDAFRIPFQEIQPQRWKKEFGLNSNKENSINVCRQLFPDVELIPKGCRKPHDGIAEALLCAEYAKRKLTAPAAEKDFDEEHWD